MNDSRNMILAIVLSMAVLFGWQYFVAGPQLEQAQRQAEIAAQQQAEAEGADLAAIGDEEADSLPGSPAIATFETREAALASQPRVPIETPALSGSINLVGARIDDLRLNRYTETPDENSPTITLLSPASGPEPYFIEQGWAVASGSSVAVPDSATQWSVAEGADAVLTEDTPLVLTWDNGEGLTFTQQISVDDNYMFVVDQSVENTGAGDVSLYPFSRVSRYYRPQTQNFFILHEGAIGVLGGDFLQRKYDALTDNGQEDFTSTGGWLGFTDKYWAVAAIPDQDSTVNARFVASRTDTSAQYVANFVAAAPTVVPAGGSASYESLAFAGAKVEAIIDSYERGYGIDRLELLIDWGWLHFITKPMFYLLRFIEGLVGNFGVAILVVTLLIKAIFFPLASKSYASMANMRRVQPEMKAIQERFADDRPAQQQAMMELYKREKINPIAGCWPVLIQIPVFFALYQTLFVTIEMRHAPFFGWIEDLAAPDPTNIFTLFGLIPWDPTVVPLLGAFLTVGIWPLIMGITMWVQMKLNPPQADPAQAMIFGLMPVIFTFMLANFPAGLVIYWAWNNFLSVLQQWFIMRRHGVEVDLLGNIVSTFRRKPKPAADAESKEVKPSK